MPLLLFWLASNWKTVLGGAVGLALGFGVASATVGPYQHHRGFTEGKDAMAKAVTQQNAAAAEAAGRARSQIDQCFAEGGEWRQEDGSCVK